MVRLVRLVVKTKDNGVEMETEVCKEKSKLKTVKATVSQQLPENDLFMLLLNESEHNRELSTFPAPYHHFYFK